MNNTPGIRGHSITCLCQGGITTYFQFSRSTWQPFPVFLQSRCYFKSNCVARAWYGPAGLLSCTPKVTSLTLSQGTCLGFGLSLGCITRGNRSMFLSHLDVSPLPSPLSNQQACPQVRTKNKNKFLKSNFVLRPRIIPTLE